MTVGNFATWNNVPTEVRFLPSHRNGVKVTAFLDIYISKRWLPGPGERSFQVIKLTKSSLVSKTIHMHFKEKEKVSPFSSFLR